LGIYFLIFISRTHRHADNARYNRKKHLPTPTQESSASDLTSILPPAPASALRVSSSTTTTTTSFSFSSPTADDSNSIPDDADEKDYEDEDEDDHSEVSGDECGSDRGSGADDTEHDPQRPCTHPALLGILLEILALSRAS
jgi:hypothetical protein